MASIVLEVLINLIVNPFIPAACFGILAVVMEARRGGRRALERLVVSLGAAFLCGMAIVATWYGLAALPAAFGVPNGYRGLFEDVLPLMGGAVVMWALCRWLAFRRAYSLPEFLCLSWFMGTGTSTAIYLCFLQDLVPMGYTPWLWYGQSIAIIACTTMYVLLLLRADREGTAKLFSGPR